MENSILTKISIELFHLIRESILGNTSANDLQVAPTNAKQQKVIPFFLDERIMRFKQIKQRLSIVHLRYCKVREQQLLINVV